MSIFLYLDSDTNFTIPEIILFTIIEWLQLFKLEWTNFYYLCHDNLDLTLWVEEPPLRPNGSTLWKLRAFWLNDFMILKNNIAKNVIGLISTFTKIKEFLVLVE